MGFGGGFGPPPIFNLMFFLVLGIIITVIIMGVVRYINNATSPLLTMKARVVSKRINVTSSVHAGDEIHHHHSSTTYYATFEGQDGKRMELVMDGRNYGLLVEGDEGVLVYQGEWFKGFERV